MKNAEGELRARETFQRCLGILLCAAALTACGARSSLLDVDTWLEDERNERAGAGGQGGQGGAPLDPGHDEVCGKALKGPFMVRVPLPDGGSFCIDSTEVSNTQYWAFISAAVPFSQQPPICAWNDSYSQGYGLLPADNLPAVLMDWCDARAYCAWAGKRLCPGTFAMPESEGGSAWMHVCTAASTHDYPYGSAYMSGGCNGKDAGVGEAVAAGASGVCTTTSGVLDLSGNVWEWEDACESDAPDARCRVRGGSFRSDQNNLACAASFADARLTTFDDFGFRCCAD
jgi:formylglycine-generating enzyme required for sulfatase activity